MGAIEKILEDYQNADSESRLEEFLENRDLRNDFTLIDAEGDSFQTPPSSSNAGEAGGLVPHRRREG